jgi:PDDEXK-like domain of unknown function (DUF3799)
MEKNLNAQMIPISRIEAGIFSGMSSEEYFALPAINKSGLDLIDRSPAHYWALSPMNPQREESTSSSAMRLGSVLHTAILEPEQFDKRYLVAPDGVTFAMKEGKFIKDLAAAKGMTAISWKDSVTAREAARAVRESAAGEVLFSSGGMVEITIVWQDPETSVFCKARIDYLAKDYSYIVDPKSTDDARRHKFARSVAEYNYHRQAAWYTWGLSVLTGKTAPFIFAAIEKTPPYGCIFYKSSEEMLIAGLKETRSLLNIYAECLDKNEWPGYASEISDIDLPAWKKQDESKTKLETF